MGASCLQTAPIRLVSAASFWAHFLHGLARDPAAGGDSIPKSQNGIEMLSLAIEAVMRELEPAISGARSFSSDP